MKFSNPIADWRRRNSVEHTSRWVGQHEGFDTTPLPRLTMVSFSMGILVSMGTIYNPYFMALQSNEILGGFIFGYDTGQISGFLEMRDFLDRFGQHRPDGTAYFSNVRSGLIVSLVGSPSYSTPFVPNLIIIALYRYTVRCSHRRAHRRLGWPEIQHHPLVSHFLSRHDRPDHCYRQMVPSHAWSSSCRLRRRCTVSLGSHVSIGDQSQTYPRRFDLNVPAHDHLWYLPRCRLQLRT